MKNRETFDVRAIARFLDDVRTACPAVARRKSDSGGSPGLYDLIDTNHRYNYLRKRNPEGDETIDYNTERAKLVRAKRKTKSTNAVERKSASRGGGHRSRYD